MFELEGQSCGTMSYLYLCFWVVVISMCPQEINWLNVINMEIRHDKQAERIHSERAFELLRSQKPLLRELESLETRGLA